MREEPKKPNAKIKRGPKVGSKNNYGWQSILGAMKPNDSIIVYTSMQRVGGWLRNLSGLYSISMVQVIDNNNLIKAVKITRKEKTK